MSSDGVMLQSYRRVSLTTNNDALMVLSLGSEQLVSGMMRFHDDDADQQVVCLWVISSTTESTPVEWVLDSWLRHSFGSVGSSRA